MHFKSRIDLMINSTVAIIGLWCILKTWTPMHEAHTTGWCAQGGSSISKRKCCIGGDIRDCGKDLEIQAWRSAGTSLSLLLKTVLVHFWWCSIQMRLAPIHPLLGSR